MKCDICRQREAVLFVRQVSAQSTIELHLCTECARERGLSAAGSKLEMSLSGLLAGLLDTKAQSVSKNSGVESLRVCTGCGQSLAELQKTLRAGCPECYVCFRSEITGIMKNNGIEGPYTGSLPRKIGYFKSPLTDRLMLQSRLEEAVRAEDYEKAAVYRDRLRILERDGITVSDEHHDSANPDILKEGADE